MRSAIAVEAPASTSAVVERPSTNGASAAIAGLTVMATARPARSCAVKVLGQTWAELDLICPNLGAASPELRQPLCSHEFWRGSATTLPKATQGDEWVVSAPSQD